jgi:hypothetical protein
MTIRLTVIVTALTAGLGACAGLSQSALAPQTPAAAASGGAIGRTVDDVMAANGPPSQDWDLPDGRHAYQWQSSALSARVGPARKGKGEVSSGGVSRTTCFYTVYSRKDAKGVAKVVGFDEPSPGCMKVAAK